MKKYLYCLCISKLIMEKKSFYMLISKENVVGTYISEEKLNNMRFENLGNKDYILAKNDFTDVEIKRFLREGANTSKPSYQARYKKCLPIFT